ncbi:MAG: porin [Proteobacteria bacterium]|nr:porin [Pseudomonadota bacterium]
MNKKVLVNIMAGIFAPVLAMSAAPVSAADTISELRAELAAQRARMDALEKKLEVAVKETVAAKEAAKQAVPAEKSAGLSMPKGLAVYGIVDAGVEIGDYGQGTKARVQSGLGSASRLGFKGERGFGNDLVAYFQLEAGVSVDNGQNTAHSSNISNPIRGTNSASTQSTTGVAVFSRNTFIGLRGKFGDVRFGRDFIPIYSITSAADPFAAGGGTAYRLFAGSAAGRFDNAIFYATPNFNGFQGKIAYSAGMENNSRAEIGASGFNTSTGPESEGKGWNASLTYKKGPLFVGASYLSYLRNGNVVLPATENVKRKAWGLAATYDFKVAKLYGYYQAGQDTQAGRVKSLDQHAWWLGVSVPFRDVHTFRAVFSHLNDRMATNRDSNHIGLGYEYMLDKETDLYVYYASVTNKNGGTNSIYAGGGNLGFDGTANLPINYTPKSLMLGARYRF